MNAKSWGALVLSTFRRELLRTEGTIPYQERNLTFSRRIIILLIVKWMKSCCMKKKKIAMKEAHENVESDFDDNKLNQIENMSLEDTKEIFK